MIGTFLVLGACSKLLNIRMKSKMAKLVEQRERLSDMPIGSVYSLDNMNEPVWTSYKTG